MFVQQYMRDRYVGNNIEVHDLSKTHQAPSELGQHSRENGEAQHADWRQNLLDCRATNAIYSPPSSSSTSTCLVSPYLSSWAAKTWLAYLHLVCPAGFSPACHIDRRPAAALTGFSSIFG